MIKSWEYAMYKGDKCLAIGTPDEICKQMGIKKNTFQFMRANTYKMRIKGKEDRYRTIIRIDKEESVDE